MLKKVEISPEGDRELIRLAAVAAKIEIINWTREGPYSHALIKHPFHTGGILMPWMPLDSPTDSMELSIRLYISIRHLKAKRFVIAGGAIGIPYGNDPFAATRRAIVTAAARKAKV